MQRISPDKLAELLRNGFEGEVRFCGHVVCHIKEPQSTLPHIAFYENRGNFSLIYLGKIDGRYLHLLRNKESALHFKHRTEEPVTHRTSTIQPYRDIITFSIDFPTQATIDIEIEQKEIVF